MPHSNFFLTSAEEAVETCTDEPWSVEPWSVEACSVVTGSSQTFPVALVLICRAEGRGCKSARGWLQPEDLPFGFFVGYDMACLSTTLPVEIGGKYQPKDVRTGSGEGSVPKLVAESPVESFTSSQKNFHREV